MADITYTPAFRHTDWFNNVDRVDAEGPNGFNIRFHTIEDDLKAITPVVAQVSSELTRLGNPPAPSQTTLTVPPAFVSSSASPPAWVPTGQGAASPPVGRAADGSMVAPLPDGVRLLSMRVLGFTAGNTLGFSLTRYAIRVPGEQFLGSVEVRPAGNARFDVPLPIDVGPTRVDLSNFRYVIRATATSFPSPDVFTAQVDAFQFVHIAD